MSAMFSPSVCFPFTCQKEMEEAARGLLASQQPWLPWATDQATLGYCLLPFPRKFRKSLSLPSPLHMYHVNLWELCGCLCTRASLRACVQVPYLGTCMCT